MKLVWDIETDGLDNPSVIHCVCTQDLETGERRNFYGALSSYQDDLVEMFTNAEAVIGHNIINYDCKWLGSFVPALAEWFSNNHDKVIDTLVLSRLLWQDRPGGHSLEAWGERLKFPKPAMEDFSVFTPEMLARCEADVEINKRVYQRLMHKLDKPNWVKPIKTELEYQWIAREMHENGFRFNIEDAVKMLDELETKLSVLDEQILAAFPPKVEIVQMKTKTKVVETVFNPSSPKQLVDRLWEGGWKPFDKTKGYAQALKDKSTPPEKLAKFKRYGWKVNEANIETLPNDAAPEYQLLVERMLTEARKRTLVEWIDAYDPSTKRIHGLFNPLGTRTQRCVHTRPNMGNVPTKKSIKYNSKRLRDLAIEYGGRMRSMWIADDGARALVYTIGISKECEKNYQQTHTLSTQEHGLNVKEKNDAISYESRSVIQDLNASTVSLQKNVTQWLKSKGIDVFSVTVVNKTSLSITTMTPDASAESFVDNAIRNLVGMKIDGWQLSYISTQPTTIEAFLVGTDMESAHLRIFGHLIDDKQFIEALISGRKEDGTDPHSLNKRAFGDICPDRDRAKTGIFTYLNGGGVTKFREIFNCSREAAQEALDGLVRTYPGLARLKRESIPADAKRGWFQGIDGRLVINDSEHHMIGMYLQNMESVLMKYANILWRTELDRLGIRYKQVNFVHDEFVTEVYGDKKTAELVGQIQADSLREVGKKFNLNCPMSGEWKIGKNWLEVH